MTSRAVVRAASWRYLDADQKMQARPHLLILIVLKFPLNPMAFIDNRLSSLLKISVIRDSLHIIVEG
jgi:hypothetical protein